MRKIILGDIFELDTSKGKAYLHYVYHDVTIGDLIRILPGLYNRPPEDLKSLAKSKEQFMIFFPLSAASNKGIVKFVGHSDLGNFSKPSFMRIEHDNEGWDIINTDTWERYFEKELSVEHIQMSSWGVWNDTLLKERLEEGWNLESWR